jgi:hypothetical protein
MPRSRDDDTGERERSRARRDDESGEYERPNQDRKSGPLLWPWLSLGIGGVAMMVCGGAVGVAMWLEAEPRPAGCRGGSEWDRSGMKARSAMRDID